MIHSSLPQSHEDVAELATQFSFLELSAEIQQSVIKILGSAEEYTALRLAVLESRAAMQHIQQEHTNRNIRMAGAAPDFLHSALTNAHKKSEKSGKTPFLMRPVPLYRVGLAAAIAAFTVTFFYRPQIVIQVPQQQDSVAEKIVYRPVEFDRDSLATIIADSLRQLLSGNSITIQRKPRMSAVKSTAVAEALPPTDADRVQLPYNAFIGLDNVPITLAQRRGVSSADNAALEKFTYSQSQMR